MRDILHHMASYWVRVAKRAFLDTAHLFPFEKHRGKAIVNLAILILTAVLLGQLAGTTKMLEEVNVWLAMTVAAIAVFLAMWLMNFVVVPAKLDFEHHTEQGRLQQQINDLLEGATLRLEIIHGTDKIFSRRLHLRPYKDAEYIELFQTCWIGIRNKDLKESVKSVRVIIDAIDAAAAHIKINASEIDLRPSETEYFMISHMRVVDEDVPLKMDADKEHEAQETESGMVFGYLQNGARYYPNGWLAHLYLGQSGGDKKALEPTNHKVRISLFAADCPRESRWFSVFINDKCELNMSEISDEAEVVKLEDQATKALVI